jgi:hypothetical protein
MTSALLPPPSTTTTLTLHLRNPAPTQLIQRRSSPPAARPPTRPVRSIVAGRPAAWLYQHLPACLLPVVTSLSLSLSLCHGLANLPPLSTISAALPRRSLHSTQLVRFTARIPIAAAASCLVSLLSPKPLELQLPPRGRSIDPLQLHQSPFRFLVLLFSIPHPSLFILIHPQSSPVISSHLHLTSTSPSSPSKALRGQTVIWYCSRHVRSMLCSLSYPILSYPILPYPTLSHPVPSESSYPLFSYQSPCKSLQASSPANVSCR